MACRSHPRGTASLAPGDLDREVNGNDKVIVLEPARTDRLPGSLVRREGNDLAGPAWSGREKVVTLGIEPGLSPRGPFIFDPRTSAALVEIILREMTSA